MSFLTKNKIISLIKSGELKKATDAIELVTKKLDKELYQQSLALSIRFARVQKKLHLGVSNEASLDIAINQIINSALYILEQLPNYDVVDGSIIYLSNKGEKIYSLDEKIFYSFLLSLISYYLLLVATIYIVGSYIYDDFSSFINYSFIGIIGIGVSLVYSLITKDIRGLNNFFGIFSCTLILFYVSLPFWFVDLIVLRFEHVVYSIVCAGVGFSMIWLANHFSESFNKYILLLPAAFTTTICIGFTILRLLMQNGDINATFAKATNGLLFNIYNFYYFYTEHFSTHHEQLIFSIIIIVSIIYLVFALLESKKQKLWINQV